MNGPIRFGRYTIVSLLGTGGMAEVYRASVIGPEGFEKPVVIKRVREVYAQNQTFVEMFVDEARICAGLDHANVVSVFDFGEEDGNYYMAMEFIDGLDLRAAHFLHMETKGKPLPWEVLTLIMRDALRGLDYAHNLADASGQPLGIVHRDIDLANIMVRRDGAVKVLDFGCAKAAGKIRRTQTVAGVIKGKLGYMSPEQCDDKPLDARSDIFSASIVLHELLTGRRLFFGEGPLDVIKALRYREIPDPRSLNAGIPEALARIVLRGLKRNLDERYPSAGQMADDLEGIIHEHRIVSSRLPRTVQALMAHNGAVAAEQDAPAERKITLAAWTKSRGSAPPTESAGSLVVETGGFIDATIVNTNPRWMFPEESGSHAGPQDPAVPIAERRTEILLADGEPARVLSEQETELLSEEDRGAADFHERPTLMLDESDKGRKGDPPAE